MKKMSEIISNVNSVKNSPFTDAQKLDWLSALDGQINADLLHAQDYSQPKSLDDEILVPEPYDKMYVVYLMAQIDFYQGEYERYNAEISRFQTMLNNYSAYHQRNTASTPVKIRW